jgi:hypothetical protein
LNADASGFVLKNLSSISIFPASKDLFRKVTEDKVEAVFQQSFNRNVNEDHVLVNINRYLLKHGLMFPLSISFHFFTAAKLILKNAGFVSPLSIDDSIARGGYKSFYKTILNYTPEKVCDIVELSELRGRGGGGYSTGKKWKVASDNSRRPEIPDLQCGRK